MHLYQSITYRNRAGTSNPWKNTKPWAYTRNRVRIQIEFNARIQNDSLSDFSTTRIVFTHLQCFSDADQTCLTIREHQSGWKQAFPWYSVASWASSAQISENVAPTQLFLSSESKKILHWIHVYGPKEARKINRMAKFIQNPNISRLDFARAKASKSLCLYIATKSKIVTPQNHPISSIQSTCIAF